MVKKPRIYTLAALIFRNACGRRSPALPPYLNNHRMKSARPLLCIIALCAATALGCLHIPIRKASETVTIGKQVWMTENLNVSTFRNGDEIFHARTEEEWKQAAMEEKPAWSYMNHDEAMGVKYGKLYNYFAVTDPRGLAPEGLHIPSDEEWTELIEHLGKNAGHKMKSTKKEIRSGNGNNRSGFSGKFGGHCFANGMFTNRHVSGIWWSTTERDEYTAWTIQLNRNSKDALRGSLYKSFGASVRCVKD